MRIFRNYRQVRATGKAGANGTGSGVRCGCRDGKGQPGLGWPWGCWRKRWDSNPRTVARCWFSRPVPSTTRPHFLGPLPAPVPGRPCHRNRDARPRGRGCARDGPRPGRDYAGKGSMIIHIVRGRPRRFHRAGRHRAGALCPLRPPPAAGSRGRRTSAGCAARPAGPAPGPPGCGASRTRTPRPAGSRTRRPRLPAPASR